MTLGVVHYSEKAQKWVVTTFKDEQQLYNTTMPWIKSKLQMSKLMNG